MSGCLLNPIHLLKKMALHYIFISRLHLFSLLLVLSAFSDCSSYLMVSGSKTWEVAGKLRWEWVHFSCINFFRCQWRTLATQKSSNNKIFHSCCWTVLISEVCALFCFIDVWKTVLFMLIAQVAHIIGPTGF